MSSALAASIIVRFGSCDRASSYQFFNRTQKFVLLWVSFYLTEDLLFLSFIALSYKPNKDA